MNHALRFTPAIAHVAPLGLEDIYRCACYKHAAPLGLNEPMYRLSFHVCLAALR